MTDAQEMEAVANFVEKETEPKDGSKLIRVSGMVSFSARKNPDVTIYLANMKIFVYPGGRFQVVRTSSSFNYQLSSGQIMTNITLFGKPNQPLFPDFSYNFGFSCGEKNTETVTSHTAPSDFFDSITSARWRPVSDYLSHFRVRPCS